MLAIHHMENRGTSSAPYVGGVGKWRGMLEGLEVDVVDWLVVAMVEAYWLCQFWILIVSSSDGHQSL